MTALGLLAFYAVAAAVILGVVPASLVLAPRVDRVIREARAAFREAVAR